MCSSNRAKRERERETLRKRDGEDGWMDRWMDGCEGCASNPLTPGYENLVYGRRRMTKRYIFVQCCFVSLLILVRRSVVPVSSQSFSHCTCLPEILYS